LPAGGGVLDQPAKTMEALKYLQSLLREKIADDEKNKFKVG
jgi:hypothetical protein